MNTAHTAAPTRRVRRGEVLANAVGLLLLVPVAAISFVRDRGVQWAAALAYYTLIGLVPLLVALFALIKGLGLHRGLTPLIVRTIGAGSPEVSIHIVRFIDQTNVRAVGVLSVIGAVLAVFAILGNAELCLNSIWGGIPGRPVLRKVRAFVGVAGAVPAMVLLALAGTTFLRHGTATWAFFEHLYLGDVVLFVLRLVPYTLLWLSFTMLYTVLPNRPVRVRSAVVGAVVAGSLWQVAQWAYVTFVIKLVRYSAFYGALWQLPILLAWVYVAWTIVLFGAEVCRVHHEEVDARVSLRRAARRRRDTERVE
ncbi:MAG: YihY/virulence factor BrkB family protein [Candidatus Binatia bacterium]